MIRALVAIIMVTYIIFEHQQHLLNMSERCLLGTVYDNIHIYVAM